ncbi:hypothetical protein N0V90_000379 [Kalmusia sp. IMI 367209]|nr:hypothetical protein N0V90_000379 [Kalmusia sp. IMI 367209]
MVKKILRYKNYLQAINYATNKWKVNVISLPFALDQEEPIVVKAIKHAYASEVAVFAAAANHGGRDGVAFPTYHLTVFCIHACDGAAKPAAFTPQPDSEDNTFTTLGVSVLSVCLEHCVDSSSLNYSEDMPGKWTYASGTSMATPLAAALAVNLQDFCQIFYDDLREQEPHAMLKKTFKSMSRENNPYRPLTPWYGHKGEYRSRTMRNYKAYFLLPDTEIAPDTLIQLGQIVPSVRELRQAIGIIQPLKSATYSSIKTGYEYSTASTTDFSIGLFAQFLARLGSPASGRLRTDKEYIDRSVQGEHINARLAEGKWVGNAVYIVTAKASINPTILVGVPISEGPKANLELSSSVKETYNFSFDFVWAVRVRKIHLSFWGKKLVVKDVFGGQLCGVESGSEGPYLDDMCKKPVGDSKEKELNGVEVEVVVLRVHYTPKKFNKGTGRDEFGKECVVL